MDNNTRLRPHLGLQRPGPARKHQVLRTGPHFLTPSYSSANSPVPGQLSRSCRQRPLRRGDLLLCLPRRRRAQRAPHRATPLPRWLSDGCHLPRWLPRRQLGCLVPRRDGRSLGAPFALVDGGNPRSPSLFALAVAVNSSSHRRCRTPQAPRWGSAGAAARSPATSAPRPQRSPSPPTLYVAATEIVLRHSTARATPPSP